MEEVIMARAETKLEDEKIFIELATYLDTLIEANGFNTEEKTEVKKDSETKLVQTIFPCQKIDKG